MSFKSFEEIKNKAKCPEILEDESIGYMSDGEITNVHFYPGYSNIDYLNNIEKEDILCCLDIYTHGVLINVQPSSSKSNYFIINNSLIEDFDIEYYDEVIESKKDIHKYIQTGILLGSGIPGSIIGGAIGALASIGKKKERIKGTLMRIVFWDWKTKNLYAIILDYKGDKERARELLETWKENKNINESTGRKPSDCKPKGCLSSFIIGIVSTTISILNYFF